MHEPAAMQVWDCAHGHLQLTLLWKLSTRVDLRVNGRLVRTLRPHGEDFVNTTVRGPRGAEHVPVPGDSRLAARLDPVRVRSRLGFSAHGGAHAALARRGAPDEGGGARRRADPGRHRRDGRAQLPPRPAGDAPEPERGRPAAGLVARERDAAARLGPHVHRGDEGAARRAVARAGRGLANRGLPADPQPRDDRRQPRHRLARRRRAAAAAPRGRGDRGRERRRRAPRGPRGVPRRPEEERARAERADRRGAPGAERPPADLHEGRAAERDGDRRLLARRPRRPRAGRAAGGVRLGRPRARPRDGAARRARCLSGAGRERGQPDRRRPRQRRLPAPRAEHPRARAALERCLAT